MVQVQAKAKAKALVQKLASLCLDAPSAHPSSHLETPTSDPVANVLKQMGVFVVTVHVAISYSFHPVQRLVPSPHAMPPAGFAEHVGLQVQLRLLNAESKTCTKLCESLT